MIKIIYFQRYHMELAIIIFFWYNCLYARFMRFKVSDTLIKQMYNANL